MGGAILLVASALTETIGHAWHLRAWERASLMSALFVGMMLGNSTSGPLGDSLGRKGVIVFSYVGTFASGLLCVFSYSFGVLCAWRFCLGLAMGLGVPPWIVLCTEITPSAWRVAMNAYSQTLFIFGEIYSALVILWSDPSMHHLEWRSLTAASILPAMVLAAFALFFLVQSPAYLATKGEHAKARAVLKSMAHQNGVLTGSSAFRYENGPAEAVESAETGDSFRLQFQALFGWRMLYSTLTVVYSCFVLNIVFYGTLYAFPQVAENVNVGTSPAVGVLLGAIWEFPGLAAGALFGSWFRRLPVMSSCCAGMAGALSCFAFAVSSHAWFSFYLLQGSLLGVKFFSNIAFVVVYQYAAEIYPAFARTTGNAVCISGGRFGAIVAPMLFEVLVDITGNFSTFFIFIAVLAAVNWCLVLMLPFETSGPDFDSELDPAVSKDGKATIARKVGLP